VLKSLSETPCRNVKIADCTVSGHCNGLKMGTESGGGFDPLRTDLWANRRRFAVDRRDSVTRRAAKTF
jgi:hypothetical protein